jgi:hypothetical protein
LPVGAVFKSADGQATHRIEPRQTDGFHEASRLTGLYGGDSSGLWYKDWERELVSLPPQSAPADTQPTQMTDGRVREIVRMEMGAIADGVRDLLQLRAAIKGGA